MPKNEWTKTESVTVEIKVRHTDISQKFDNYGKVEDIKDNSGDHTMKIEASNLVLAAIKTDRFFKLLLEDGMEK